MNGEDDVLTTHVCSIKLTSSKVPLHLHFLGDIHHDNSMCDHDAFRRTLDLIRVQHDAGIPYRIILMGDQLDRCSTSERSKLLHSKVHESTQATWDRDALRDLTKLVDALWFAKDNILGVIQGNHYWRFFTGESAGRSSDIIMAEKLGTKWLGFLSYLHLSLNYQGCCVGVDAVVCHGSRGGGKLVGSSINQVDDLRRVFPGAHIYAMGHNHKAGVIPAAALFARPPDGKDRMCGTGQLVVKERRQLLVRTGSFLKGYDQDTPSYVVRALWQPNTLGHAEVLLHVSRNRSESGVHMNCELRAVV